MTGRTEIATVVLAAGLGSRLRPLTDLRPKALCPVANVPLADGAIRRCREVTDAVAINAHALSDQIVERYEQDHRLIVSVEQPEALGTAGALGRLREWIDGRAVLVHNADAWHEADLAAFVGEWDGDHMRLLVVPRPPCSDFGPNMYAGVCLLPWSSVRSLTDTPSGLYEVLWRAAAARGQLDYVVHEGAWFDCGTPADYLGANLHASGGASVVGDGAVIGRGAEIVRSVVWPGAVVDEGERLCESIRAGDRTRRVTVHARR